LIDLNSRNLILNKLKQMQRTAEDNIPNPNLEINSKFRVNTSKPDKNVDVPAIMPPISLSLELN